MVSVPPPANHPILLTFQSSRIAAWMKKLVMKRVKLMPYPLTVDVNVSNRSSRLILMVTAVEVTSGRGRSQWVAAVIVGFFESRFIFFFNTRRLKFRSILRSLEITKFYQMTWGLVKLTQFATRHPAYGRVSFRVEKRPSHSHTLHQSKQ